MLDPKNGFLLADPIVLDEELYPSLYLRRGRGFVQEFTLLLSCNLVPSISAPPLSKPFLESQFTQHDQFRRNRSARPFVVQSVGALS
jgi:hypothetical protein